MKIYLAGRFSRKEELKKYASSIEMRGHICTSEWLKTEYGTENNDPEVLRTNAYKDLMNVVASDAIIAFTDSVSPDLLVDLATGVEHLGEWTRGGRHVEMGVALALNKLCYIVGPRENIFHRLDQVKQFGTLEACLTALPRYYIGGELFA